MKCYSHNDKDSVSQCKECGLFLCKECSDNFTHNGRIVCERCADKINNIVEKSESEIRNNLYMIFSFYLIIILGFIISIIFNLSNGLDITFNIGRIYYLFLLIYLRKEIPIPRVFLMGGWIFWIIILFLYLYWGMIYLTIIYPIKNFKYLIKK